MGTTFSNGFPRKRCGETIIRVSESSAFFLYIRTYRLTGIYVGKQNAERLITAVSRREIRVICFAMTLSVMINRRTAARMQ